MLDIIDAPTGAASVNMMTQEGLYTAEKTQLLLSCYVNLLTAFTEDPDLAAGEVNQAFKLGQGMS